MEMSSADPSASHTASPCSFHPFSRLPTELRLRIWSLTEPHTRLVPITCGGSPSLYEPSSTQGHGTGCMSNAAIPAILHACRESRALALQHYGFRFGFARGPGQVAFDPLKDILFFGPREGYMAASSQFHTFMSLCAPADVACVQRIAISDCLFWLDHQYRSMTAGMLTVDVIKQLCLRIPSLIEIIFIPRDEDLGTCPSTTTQRMSQQIQASMDVVRQQFAGWTPPRWRILPLQSFVHPTL
ncbi:hypothetical protein S7711_05740 [Stachybotrys chartarum IBT 7711]|uniref:2EXR domain-containing protein n=1 Tax=Stachybotrys chartarum (strain CBS 109288 / IBT 7711) TaxID=1280523 RepID=A0A084AVU7_STACB|nr:hypothetical protein S7711_05740 [Stachybotrys chartarum IBT 7711]KFA45586.1 hypothetical protein S40293_09425 [Stachybotrys chartarum IBT 40293]KFA75272.1 hypothetical protein S40288_00130 [Stachybotrys chartarum IBT 40288]